jgi:hypothetical protein
VGETLFSTILQSLCMGHVDGSRIAAPVPATIHLSVSSGGPSHWWTGRPQTLRTSSDLSLWLVLAPSSILSPPLLISRQDALFFPAIYTFIYFLLYLSFDQASPGSCSSVLHSCIIEQPPVLPSKPVPTLYHNIISLYLHTSKEPTLSLTRLPAAYLHISMYS